MKDMGFCILTPREVEIELELLSNSRDKFDIEDTEAFFIEELLTFIGNVK